MDNRVQAILAAKEAQIDIELQQELIKVEEEFTLRGIPGSGPHHRAMGLAEAKANARKDELRAIIAAEYNVFQETQLPNLDKAVLKIIDGSKGIFEFISRKGEVRAGSFRPGTSEFKILMHLANNNHTSFETTKLIDHLNQKRQNADDADDKQRVLDKITSIRRKLGKETITTTSDGFMIDYEIIKT